MSSETTSPIHLCVHESLCFRHRVKFFAARIAIDANGCAVEHEDVGSVIMNIVEPSGIRNMNSNSMVKISFEKHPDIVMILEVLKFTKRMVTWIPWIWWHPHHKSIFNSLFKGPV